MALNFTVSYTFAPNTTISSSQVNTNTNDVASVFTGLEAKTKSFSNLVVDTMPTLSTDVAIKSYVDNLNGYRRPNLSFSSVTTVTIETGLNGTSGAAVILFPDGTRRTDSTSSHILFDITRNAALSGTAQSGLRSTLSEATNTWYAIYAVKVTDSTTDFVLVGDTRLPLQANFANLNTAFGTNGWVYLGMIRNGDNSGATGDILNYNMNGSITLFRNICACNVANTMGLQLATTAGATSLTYTYSVGTGTTDIPNHISVALLHWNINTGSGLAQAFTGSGDRVFQITDGAVRAAFSRWIFVSDTEALNGSSVKMDIQLQGWIDPLLGVGANPLL